MEAMNANFNWMCWV